MGQSYMELKGLGYALEVLNRPCLRVRDVSEVSQYADPRGRHGQRPRQIVGRDALFDHLAEPGGAPDEVAAEALCPAQHMFQLTAKETVADILRDPQSFLGSHLSRGRFSQHTAGHQVESDDLRQRPGIPQLPREFRRLCEVPSGHLAVARVDDRTAGRQRPHHERRVADFPCSCQGLLGLFAALGRACTRRE